MLDASSFDKNVYNQLKLIVDVQKSLIRLNPDNINEVGSQLLKRKELVQTKEGITLLSNCFIEIADAQPMNIENLSDLFKFLHKTQSPSNSLHLLNEQITAFIHLHTKLGSSALFFLRSLLNRNVITIESIINEIKLIQSDFRFDHANVIKWFYPEIDSVYHKMIDFSRFQIPVEFQVNDFETALKIMNDGYNPIEIAQIIKNDDIDTFSEIVSKFGDNFNFNQMIHPISYERSPILNKDTSLIQYAAFFNSIKIFKYLYLHKVDLDESLVEHAISGGSIEIIHILAQNRVELNKGVPISIQFFRNDILRWIIDNYEPDEYSDFTMTNNGSYSQKEKELILKKYISNGDDEYYNYFSDNDDLNYSDNDDDNDFDDIDDDQNNRQRFLRFYDYNLIFNSIMESNNFLALFVFFDYGMDINARDRQSKKTLLHFAVQKGKLFYVKLLLSNEYIKPLLKDSNGETPLEYSLRYMRHNIFNFMIQNERVLNSITDDMYVKMYRYCENYKNEEVLNFIMKNWDKNLLNMTSSMKYFCDVMTYVPLSLFIDQIKPTLIQLFETKQFRCFSILISKILNDKEANFKGNFYFLDSEDKTKEYGEDFVNLCQLLEYYRIGKFRLRINYYAWYSSESNNFKKYKLKKKQLDTFSISNQDSVCNVFLTRAKIYTHSCDIEFQYTKK